MLRAERHQAILELVTKKGIVAIEDLMDALGSSKATARRDINELAEQQLLVKIRGGAKAVVESTPPILEPSFMAKSLVNSDEKQRIAQAAIKHIHPGSCIFLDSGTTIWELAKLLVDESDLTVVTNDIRICAELTRNQKSTVLFVGGMIRKGFSSSYGYYAEQMLSELSVSQMFFSVDAVDDDFNITSYTMDDIGVKKIGLAQASERILLIDHSKFSIGALFNICSLANIETIIVGSELDPRILERLRHSGKNVEVV